MDIADIELRLSGGASNTDPAASLGGIISSETVKSQGLSGTMAGVTLVDGSGNTAGNGTLTFTYNGGTGRTLQWTPPGGSIGAAVVVDTDARYTLPGADDSQYIVVETVHTSLPGSDDSQTIAVTDLTNEIYDDIDKTESYDGRIEFRCLYLINNGDDTAVDPRLYVASGPSGADSLTLGMDPAGLNGTPSAVPAETTAPAGVTFAAATDTATALAFGNLDPGEFYPFWLKRTVPAETQSGTASDVTQLAIVAVI